MNIFETEEKQFRSAEEEAKQERQEIAAMAQTAGWARLRAWLSSGVSKLKEELVDVDASRPTDVIRLQQRIVASEQIIRVIQSYVDEEKALQEAAKQEKANGRV